MTVIPGQRFSFCRPTGRGFFLALLALITFYAVPASAQPASCDPAYWSSMSGKAWMEAQREIAQNQNIIYKPDSVLEYTCFDRFLSVLAGRAPDMFSETTTWGVIPGPNMVLTLQNLVGTALSSYVGSNFDHNFLGGRSNVNYNPGAVTRSTNYTCDMMARAWAAAKCLNFVQQTPVDRTARDDFFNLNWYETNDPRDLPASMAACTADARWATKRDLALNTGASKYLEETFNVYANQFATTGCPAGAIPTGVVVTLTGKAPYDEKVCINPGCAYTPPGTCSPTAGSPP